MALCHAGLQYVIAVALVIAARCSAAASQTQVVKINGGVLSYFKVTVPPGGTLRISASSARPVALMAASGYLPSESHYEVSNFVDWMKGARKTQLEFPIDKLRTSACDPPGILTGCFELMSKQGLNCGKAVSRQHSPSVVYSPELDDQATGDACQKYIGTCSNGVCEEQRGPTTCNVTNPGTSDRGSCVCQQGYCEISGKCINAELVHTGCYKITGNTCSNFICDPASGPANCENGICVCKPGFCSVGGVCLPGASCGEFAPREECEVASEISASSRRLVEDRRTTTIGLGADDCCRVVDTSRGERPSQFARCTARHFFSVQEAFNRGLHAKVLADFPPGGAEVIISLRGGSALEGERSELQVDLTIEALTSTDDITVGPLGEFSTIEELVAPPLPKSGIELSLFEVPLVASHDDASLPGGQLSMSLRRGEPAFIKLTDVSLAAARQGVLQLHLEGLPEGSNVLYSRSWPGPVSLMDFGHATLAAEVDVGRKGSVWQAASLNTRFFAVIPSRAAKVAAFFKVDALSDGRLGEMYGEQESSFLLQGTGAAAAAAAILGMVGVMLWKWHACHVEVPHHYINIHGNAIDPTAEIEEAPNQSDHTGQFLSALRSIRDEIKEKTDVGLAAWSYRLASVSTRVGTTRRSLDSDDEDIEDYHSDEREELMQPLREDECSALLENDDCGTSSACTRLKNNPARIDSGDEDDQDALNALLKLRPAAQDSIGNDCDDDDEAACPLMGSARLSALSR